MITLEKIDKLYDLEYKNEIEIRAKVLNEIGFNLKILMNLLKKDILKGKKEDIINIILINYIKKVNYMLKRKNMILLLSVI